METTLELPLPACRAQEHWTAFSATEPAIASQVVASVEPMGERFSRLTLAGTSGATEIAVDAFMDLLARAWPPRAGTVAENPQRVSAALR